MRLKLPELPLCQREGDSTHVAFVVEVFKWCPPSNRPESSSFFGCGHVIAAAGSSRFCCFHLRFTFTTLAVVTPLAWQSPTPPPTLHLSFNRNTFLGITTKHRSCTTTISSIDTASLIAIQTVCLVVCFAILSLSSHSVNQSTLWSTTPITSFNQPFIRAPSKAYPHTAAAARYNKLAPC